jgi:hypothetical protein
MTPLERADKVREAIIVCGEDWMDVLPLVPPGSLILTPDEAKQVHDEITTLVLNISGGWSDGQPYDPEVREALALLAGKGQT